MSNKMIETHKRWLRKDGFTAEIAAYEYMKRNPYFIETVYFFNQQINELRDDADRIEDLQFVLDRMKVTLQRLFLYSGSDVLNSNKIGRGDFTYIHNQIESILYQVNSSTYPNKDTHYNYSDIYEQDTYKLPGTSSEEYKKLHSLDMDKILDNQSSERWLGHLLPSLYLKINPYHSQERLRLDFLAVLQKIEQELPMCATPEILINEYNVLEDTFKSSNSFRPKPSAIALIVYDLINIVQFDASSAKEYLTDIYGEEYKELKFDQYFTEVNIGNDDYVTKFESKMIKSKMKIVMERINGGYLDLVYPDDSQKAHFDLLTEKFLRIYQVDDFDEGINTLKSSLEIDNKLEHLLLHVKNFTDDECKEWSKSVYEGLKIPPEDINKIILM